MGWRYLFYTCGAMVFVLSIARVLVIRFHETPKFLLCQGMDEEVIQTLQNLARKHNRPCQLTLEQLQACGQIRSAHAENKASFSELVVHVRGLFSTRIMTLSTSLVWFSWALIGLGYALYYHLISPGATMQLPISAPSRVQSLQHSCPRFPFLGDDGQWLSVHSSQVSKN
jgi:hypothetical protein